MPEFKLTINDVKTGKSYKKVISDEDSDTFRGKKIKDKVDGAGIGLKGYEFEITGGSDNAGFPMRGDIEGSARKRPLISKGPGVKIKRKGMRTRKRLAGNQLNHLTSQINLKVVKYGAEELVKVFGKEEKSAEKAAEEAEAK